jgi:hypothetical protein
MKRETQTKDKEPTCFASKSAALKPATVVSRNTDGGVDDADKSNEKMVPV